MNTARPSGEAHFPPDARLRAAAAAAGSAEVRR